MRKNIFLKLSFLIMFLVFFGLTFYLINFDFKSLTNFGCQSKIEKATQQYGIPNYWLEKYSLSLASAEDLNADADSDGLSLQDEYKYFTNPLDPDTDKDNYTDGVEIEAGYDPTSLGRLDFDKDGLPDWWEKEVGLAMDSNDYALDPDGDTLPNYLEYTHGTDPKKADTDGDSFSDQSEIQNGYDPSKAGDARPKYAIVINKINVKAPVIWSKSTLEEDLQKDLQGGLVRYPKTGIPGQFGNAFITGHSSNYVWAKGAYNYILKDMNNLNIGDEIVITATQDNGKVLSYKYIITVKEVVTPEDERLFQETEKPTLTVTTCWPLGTNWKRLMVKADFVQ